MVLPAALVGMVAIGYSQALGYDVGRGDGQRKNADLKSIGAKDDAGTRPVWDDRSHSGGDVLPGRWTTLGGEQLSWLTRVMKVSGTIASVRPGAELGGQTTVMPFILRGVLLRYRQRGARWRCAANCGAKLANGGSATSWQRIAARCRFARLPTVFDAYVKGAVTGRTVVQVS